MTEVNDTLRAVREYYGKVLESNKDLKTTACCTLGSLPAYVQAIVHQIAGEVREKFYGCGSPIPPAIEGCTVLDLGCGTGRDAYVCSKLVGETGSVIGVDMTAQQLDVARRYREDQAAAFGYASSNVTFLEGLMEDLDGLGVESDSVDVVISNCVINLSPDKRSVFAEILRVLKPGGELHFSDVFVDRRLPAELMQDEMLLGECLSGAMYVEDFRRLLASLGVADYRVVSSRRIEITNDEVRSKTGAARFYSMTVRAFKLEGLDDRCEDFGQVATYLGTIPHSPGVFALDLQHEFTTGKPMLVCGNTAAILTDTRLGPHFAVQGDQSTHYGLFGCPPHSRDADAAGLGPCC